MYDIPQGDITSAIQNAKLIRTNNLERTKNNEIMNTKELTGKILQFTQT